MSPSIHFCTVTNALDRIIVSGDFILSDLSLPIIRHARSCSALDLLIKVCHNLGPLASEVGWPVPFLTACSSSELLANRCCVGSE